MSFIWKTKYYFDVIVVAVDAICGIWFALNRNQFDVWVWMGLK